MKNLIAILCILTGLSAAAQPGKATTERKTFNRTTTIAQTIRAEPEVIWSLLTNANDFHTWNSTVISIEGTIAQDEKIRLRSTLDSSRTFKLKVKEFVPGERLVWGDGMGERVYTLQKTGAATDFTMTEKIGSFMFPLFANQIPSFDASFEQFTADLKKEAEAMAVKE